LSIVGLLQVTWSRTGQRAPFIIGAALLATLIALSSWIVVRQQTEHEAVRHTLEVNNRLARLLSRLQDAEVGQRGYLLTEQSSYLDPYNSAVSSVPADLDELDRLTGDNPRQKANLTALRPLIAQKFSELRQTIDLKRAADEAGALALVRTDLGRAVMDKIRETIESMQAEEERLLTIGQHRVQRTWLIFQIIMIGAAALVVVLALAALWNALERMHHAEALRDALAARFERKLVAIMAADVEGYSRHMERNELETLSTLFAHRRTIDSLILEHRGRMVSTAGDSVLAEFASVAEAADCAIGIQRSLGAADEKRSPDRRLRFRIGINMGDVMVQDGDIFGDSVNLAARLQALAKPGGICVSHAVYEHLRKHKDCGFEDLGLQSVKNIATPIHAYRVTGSAPTDSDLFDSGNR
jgi:class 3 adenylate cyclase/CHASE3 domain sensor protein